MESTNSSHKTSCLHTDSLPHYWHPAPQMMINEPTLTRHHHPGPLTLRFTLGAVHPSKVKSESVSRVCLFVTPRTVARRAPLPMEFSSQEYWNGYPFPSPGDLPGPGTELWSHTLQVVLYHLSHQGNPSTSYGFWQMYNDTCPPLVSSRCFTALSLLCALPFHFTPPPPPSSLHPLIFLLSA